MKGESEQNAIYYDKTQRERFRGKPLFQATKKRLNGIIINSILFYLLCVSILF